MTRERKLRSEGTAIEYMNRRPAQQSSASKPSQGERAQTCPRNFEWVYCWYTYMVLERMARWRGGFTDFKFAETRSG